MGTRSLIARQIGPEKYRTIFCKIGGHLESQGVTLLQHFNTSELVDKLLDLGDLYQLLPKLEQNLERNHSYAPQKTDVMIAYQQDSNSTDTDAQIYTLEELDSSNGMIEFIYIFDQKNQWKYFQGGYSQEGLRDVQEDLHALEQGVDILKDPLCDLLDELQDELWGQSML